MTFGAKIKEFRVFWELSQKDLAALIKKEDGNSISTQYLCDMENDRRGAPSDALILQFAEELNLSSDHLFYLAGRIPPDLRDREFSKGAMAAFRRAIKESADA